MARGKKCIPGLFCVENMTLFVAFIGIIVIIYLLLRVAQTPTKIVITQPSSFGLSAGSPFSNELGLSSGSGPDALRPIVSDPPLINSDMYNLTPSSVSQFVIPTVSTNMAVPTAVSMTVPTAAFSPTPNVNIQTRPSGSHYQQIGILTKNVGSNNGEPLILPLMGKYNGRDKWQYYTASNTPGAAISARLPVSNAGKSCTGEYGCDEVYNGDSVYVDGYNDVFRATVYEKSTFNYIPM